MLGNFGVESDIVGTLLGMKEGEEVGPVAGNSSAFILKNVKFAAPEATTSLEEVAAPGWGDEFSDDEITPGKVAIMDESSDWDDDERSGGKILVLREEFSKNQN